MLPGWYQRRWKALTTPADTPVMTLFRPMGSRSAYLEGLRGAWCEVQMVGLPQGRAQHSNLRMQGMVVGSNQGRAVQQDPFHHFTANHAHKPGHPREP
jgi:hypothetical protein